MLELFFSNPMIILYSLLFGITMKVADLLDEHGLKWFKGSPILFGFLWGGFGALMTISNNTIANLMIAMSIAFIVRNRLDYLNHQIAASIIIISFLFSSTLEPITFIAFLALFIIFGGLRDYIGDKIIDKKKRKKIIHKIYDDVMWYYPIPTLIYCIAFGNWIVFWSFLIYTIGYDGTKFIFKKKMKHKLLR